MEVNGGAWNRMEVHESEWRRIKVYGRLIEVHGK